MDGGCYFESFDLVDFELSMIQGAFGFGTVFSVRILVRRLFSCT